MRFTRNSKVTMVISQITIICLITMLLAIAVLSVTAHVSRDTADTIMLPAFFKITTATIIFSILWTLSEKLFPPIFDYLILEDEGKIYFVFVCEPIRVDNNTLKCTNDEMEFYSDGELIKIKYDQNVIEYLKKLGAKFQ